MTIRLPRETTGEKYKLSDYQPLAHHYKERILQVHVMSEYARLGLLRIQAAVDLVLAYFRLSKEEFLRRYFQLKPELLQHATTASSFQKIVTDLANTDQIRVVTAPAGKNMLILAGPGSGKTKVVVHRCAYLLRVARVRPQSILVCCFNRHAAIELRRRLTELVGDDSKGVTVLTYHGLAMRLLGFSYSAQAQTSRDIDFEEIIHDATRLLEGERVPVGFEADEVRSRLLTGFQYILVDEYQDIDEPQYRMISAIAGRTLDDADLRLSILAVGDDDQNIYTFRGANVRFIRQFKADYHADVHYLVENYRSTRHIIAAANTLIAANQDRMKTEHPIRIDRRRSMLPQGGEFENIDLRCRGRVQIIEVADVACQAEAVVAELKRLRECAGMNWSAMAVLSREHTDLAQVRALAERESIPIRWLAHRNAIPALHQIREVWQFLAHLAEIRTSFLRVSELRDVALRLRAGQPQNAWTGYIDRMLEAWERESGDSPCPVQDALEFFYETCAESRREVSYGEGVTLSTVHSAKGTEYDHVLVIGPWRLPPTRVQQEEERRTFYVGLTRARKTLAVLDRLDTRPSIVQEISGGAIFRYQFTVKTASPMPEFLDYTALTLEDINLGYPGQFRSGHPVHISLAALSPGAKLTMRAGQGNGIGFFDHLGTCVARLSRAAQSQWENSLPSIREVRVLAMVRRTADQDPDEIRRARYLVQEWEVPIVEIVSDP
jgi:ATP-dependent DNA helicase RecQ